MRAAFRPLWRELRIAYYELALQQINPLNDDVPYIVARINELKAERLDALNGRFNR
jgi:hypothetical protein